MIFAVLLFVLFGLFGYWVWSVETAEWDRLMDVTIELHSHSGQNVPGCPACRLRALRVRRRKIVRLALGAVFAALVLGFLFWTVRVHAAPVPSHEEAAPCCCHPSPDGRGGKCTPCAYQCRFPHFGVSSFWDVPSAKRSHAVRTFAASAKPRRSDAFAPFFAWWASAMPPSAMPSPAMPSPLSDLIDELEIGARDQSWPPPRSCCRDEMGVCHPCAFPQPALP